MVACALLRVKRSPFLNPPSALRPLSENSSAVVVAVANRWPSKNHRRIHPKTPVTGAKIHLPWLLPSPTDYLRNDIVSLLFALSSLPHHKGGVSSLRLGRRQIYLPSALAPQRRLLFSLSNCNFFDKKRYFFIASERKFSYLCVKVYSITNCKL